MLCFCIDQSIVHANHFNEIQVVVVVVVVVVVKEMIAG